MVQVSGNQDTDLSLVGESSTQGLIFKARRVIIHKIKKTLRRFPVLSYASFLWRGYSHPETSFKPYFRACTIITLHREGDIFVDVKPGMF